MIPKQQKNYNPFRSSLLSGAVAAFGETGGLGFFICYTFLMDIAKWSDRIIHWGYYLLFALVPLLLTPWNYELFEYNKMMAVYGLTVIITGAWLVKSISQGEFRIGRTPLDIPIALFFVSQLVSSIFSIDPHVSWFGYYSRFNGGMLSVISYVLLYYALVSNLTNLSNWSNLLKVALATASVVALYGVAERLGIDKHLWVQDVQNRVFSTLGQPNWLAAYLVALIPIAMAFTINQGKKSFYWSLTPVLFFLVLLFTRSRSGLLGFVVADVVFWGLVFLQTKRILLPFLILHFIFFVIIFFNGTSIAPVDRWLTLEGLGTRPQTSEATPSAYTAPLLESGGTESGTIRKYVWQGAINAWKSSPKTILVGTGTETFAFAFYQFRPREHNLTSEWDFLYNKAHNEYLNYLATTGVLGLGSYLLLIVSFLLWFVKNFKSQIVVSFALFAGYVSILVTNFFGFSVVVVQLFLFLFPAMTFVLDKERGMFRLRVGKQTGRIGVVFVSLVSLVLFVLLVLGWYADTLYASGYRASRAGQYDRAGDFLVRASAISPWEPLYFDELGSATAGLVAAVIEEKDATKAAALVKQSLSASDRAIAISPKNVNFWKTRTKIYYAFSSFDGAFNEAAIEALEQALRLSPADPKIIYNLAILHGRKGTNDRAIGLLKATIALKPNYRDAYYALWVFYTEEKKPQLARLLLEEYLAKVDPNDKDFLERLKQ